MVFYKVCIGYRGGIIYFMKYSIGNSIGHSTGYSIRYSLRYCIGYSVLKWCVYIYIHISIQRVFYNV